MSLLEEVRGNRTLAEAGRGIAAAGRNVWLAGLGALAEVTEASRLAEVKEGGRKFFSSLVEKGRPVEARRREQVEALAGKAEKSAQDLGRLAQDQALYEGRRLMKRLNVMSREDLKALSRRIDLLSQKLDELAGRAPVVLAEGNENLSAAGEEARASEPAPRAPRQRRTAKR